VAPGAKPGKIQFKTENVWGAHIGTLEIPGGGNGKTLTTLTADIKLTKDVHSLYLNFIADDNDSFSVDWFEFKR